MKRAFMMPAFNDFGRAVKRGPLMLAVLSLSALLNVLLIAAIWREFSRDAVGEFVIPSGRADVQVPAAQTNSSPPFRWAGLESTNYQQYVENLRAIGCPETVIEDILRADLNQQYVGKMAKVWRPTPRQYWQKPRREQPGKEEIAQLQALSEEKARISQELLGTTKSEQAWADLILFQVQGREQQLLFLPQEKQAAALHALAESGLGTKEARAREEGGSPSRRAELFQEKLKVLSQVLSQDELEEFRLRYSLAAENLRIELQYFDCSFNEFKALLDSREKGNAGHGNLLDRRAATAEAIKLFGEERGREFEKVTDLFYVNARRATEEHGLPSEIASKVWEITQSTRRSIEILLADPTFSVPTKLQSVRHLRTDAEAQLIQLMGETAARAVVRDLTSVLTSMERSLQQ